MVRQKMNKQALLSDLAEHVLEYGLNNASLRPMAAAAGTSDRMLIYHFGSKDALIVSVLEHLAARMEVGLDAALPAERFETESALIARVMERMRSKAFRPYTRVWLEIVAAAAQGNDAHLEAGRAIIDLYLDWLSVRHPEGAAGAAKALTIIEGCLVMDAVGQERLVDMLCDTDGRSEY